jgi:hypothetical protein
MSAAGIAITFIEECFMKGSLFAVLLLLLVFHSSAQELFTDISINLQPIGYFTIAKWGDYDNDGDLDIFISGRIGSTWDKVSKIYRNDGADSFVDIEAGLIGVWGGSAAWGDYDNDNDLDLLLTGYAGAGGQGTEGITKIYRNDNGSFTDINSPLQGVYMSSAAWVDYDNDGDLDIFIMGYISQVPNNPTAKIYRNDIGNFIEISTSITPLSNAGSNGCAWGDYDNDGRIDLAIVGSDNLGNYTSKIYHNNGNGIFNDINAELVSVQSGAIAWGDYDSDGDLDLLLTGGITSPYIGVTKIYKNDSGNFVDIEANLSGTDGQGPIAKWGDYDNDGDLDVLIAGNLGWFSLRTRLYSNDSGSFIEIPTSLENIYCGDADWGDYDNDGDLDILLVGHRSWGSTQVPDIAKVYKNNLANSNTVPTAPDNLISTISNNSVIVHWNKAIDDETVQNGLTYNLRIGKTVGGVEVISPMSNALNGYRKVVQMGNVNCNTSWTINNLPPGKYYWSVQAIDNAFAGSAFAEEKYFIIPAPYISVTIDIKPGSFPNSINCQNQNGVIPVAILSTPEFDARTVDHTTVRFGPSSGKETHCLGGNGGKGQRSGMSNDCPLKRHEEDVDGDGDIDLVFHFRHSETGLTCSDTIGALTGKTYSGQNISGSDAIRPVRSNNYHEFPIIENATPSTYALSENYPNPFNPATVIKYGLPEDANVMLSVFNTLGQEVASLASGFQKAGYHEVTFDGSGLTSGVYFYRIQANNYLETKKLVLMK